ncbi:hypothetical protein PR048_031655 [Dryococelus australis]|uniref:Transposase n=1 Tax=Dryococelus australis TaxID=614101 RepID=A0ABQ9G5W8_9NEOP|nr:hypothetical protein PR048_031655 [Dryococelus australis]
MVENVATKICGILTSANSLSVTSDIWTFKSGNDFISVTVHFIDNDWQYKHLVLEVCSFSGESHTATFSKWDISMYKIVGIVTDNAANMKCAVSQLGISFVSCLVHSLQLAVNSGCLKQKSVTNVTSTWRRIVGHFHHSVLAKKCLTKARQDLQIPEHCLIQDELTIWDSTYSLTLVFQSLQLPSGVELTNQDRELAEVLVKPLNGKQYSLFRLPWKVCVGGKRVKMLAKKLLAETTHWFSYLESSTLHAVATLLDPSYKDKFIFYFNVFLNKIHAAEAVQALTNEIGTKTKLGENLSTTAISKNISSSSTSELFGYMSEIIKKNSDNTVGASQS